MKFEDLVEQLEAVVKSLENNEIGLDESLELFNKGINLSKKCISILEDSKGKITQLKEELGKLNEVECEIK